MKRMRVDTFGSLSLGLMVAVAAPSLHGCDAGDIARECGLDVDCEAGGFAEGKASISGVASIDAFFGAAIDLEASMVGLSGELRAELDAIGASVGLEPGASGAELQTAVEQHINGFVDGSLSIEFQPAKCQASVEAGVAAAAECDAEVEPGSVSAKCSGSCQVEAGAEVDCGVDAELMCSGTAPNLVCDGTCTGSCVTEFSAAARCDGTCRGSCTAGGSTMDGFDGRCDGECEGECALDASAGATCDAKCEGNCEYRAPGASCDATATASCEANAGASIECDAGCEGSVEPPAVSAECEATVEAKASASIECTPPTLAFGFEWAAGVDGDLDAQARFRAWLEGFRLHFGAILAARAKAEVIGEAALNLVASTDLIGDAVAELGGSGSFKVAIGARCAIAELPIAFGAIGSASEELTANVGASAELVTAFE